MIKFTVEGRDKKGEGIKYSCAAEGFPLGATFTPRAFRFHGDAVRYCLMAALDLDEVGAPPRPFHIDFKGLDEAETT